jgi:ABC-2 type transport system ATP-binding protein
VVFLIKAVNLTKKFGDFTAVDNLNLDVSPGQIFGFLGPNGAGKTTTIKMLTGVLKPTSGKVYILDLDMESKEIEIKKRIGVVNEEPKIYSHLKGYEYLKFIMDIFQMNNSEIKRRIHELCEAFGVDYLDKFISDMSHGMKQKLVLISVLMRKPEVIFLDEPTVGLDAKSAKILKELLKKYAEQGITIFLTTHILEIAEKMCEKIAIINKGRKIAEGTMDELRKMGKYENMNLEELFLELTASEEDIKSIVEQL